jgi:hypothetical protein
MPSGICQKCGCFSRVHLLWETESKKWVCISCFHDTWPKYTPSMPCGVCKTSVPADCMFGIGGKIMCNDCRLKFLDQVVE